jgi:hypothetical protein
LASAKNLDPGVKSTMAKIIKLATYKRQRDRAQAQQLTAIARATLQLAHREMRDLREHVEERAGRLLDMAARLPDDSKLRIELELASGECLDIAMLIGGGDPRAAERWAAAIFTV